MLHCIELTEEEIVYRNGDQWHIEEPKRKK